MLLNQSVKAGRLNISSLVADALKSIYSFPVYDVLEARVTTLSPPLCICRAQFQMVRVVTEVKNLLLLF